MERIRRGKVNGGAGGTARQREVQMYMVDGDANEAFSVRWGDVTM